LFSVLKSFSFRALFAFGVGVSAAVRALPAQADVSSMAPGAFVRELADPTQRLPDTQVSAIAQTADGYLWLGTRRGLVRYDGLGTTMYSPNTTPALRSWAINALTADARGALWISTDRGLAVYENGVFRAIPPDQVPASTVWKVARDKAGRVWVTGSFGVRVGDGRRFTAVPHFNEYIYALAEDATGRMWFGGRQVLASYTVGDSAPRRWAPAATQRVYDMAMAPGASSTLWIAVREGIQSLDITDPARIVEGTRVPTALGRIRAQVWSMAFDGTGALWLGTDTRGVLRYADGALRDVDSDERSAKDPVWWMFRDLRGNMWAGTAGGLARYRRSPFRTVTAGLGVTGTWALRRDRDGTIWMSADNGQVAWYDQGRWHPVFRNVANLSAPSIWPSALGGLFIADDAGRLWRATRTSLTDVTETIGLPAVSSYGLFEDADGTLYNNTDRGLLRAKNGVVDSLYKTLGLSANDRPRMVTRDSRGRLVVGGPYLTIGEGAARKRYAAAEGLTDPAVMAVYETADALWIATADSGLYVLRNDRVTALSATNRRLNRVINGLIADDDGYLWITSRTGLMRVSLADLRRSLEQPERAVVVRQFDRADGLPTTDINADYQPDLLRDRSGQIWLPTYAGPVQFDPRAVVNDTVPPQVLIEAVSVDGTRQQRTDSVWALEHPGQVAVEFAATNALVPHRVRAEYRVRGISDQWIDAGLRRTLTFGPLDGGTYQLEIRVAGEDGQWQPRLATMQITVPMSLVERRGFFAVVAGLAALLAVGFTRWRLATARSRERELSDLVSQRTADLEASRADLEVRVAERTDALSRELAERYRLEQRLQSARRMASLGRLAGGVSHEINNALTTVLGFAQLAQIAARNDERMQADLGEVVRAGRRAAGITHQLLAFARQHHTALQPLSLPAMVEENQRSLQQLCEPLTFEVQVSGAVPTIGADEGQVEQLLVNLVKNARDAKPTDGRIVVELEGITLDAAQAVGDRVLPAGRYAALSVRDQGMGMSPDVIDHLFEPFFTTKKVNEGTGLGLAVVRGIVARHDGAIEVRSVSGEGTTFRIWFPERTDAVVPDSAERELGGGGQTILLAEDDASIRQFATRMLRDHGYRVLDAEDGAAALALVGKAIEAIDLVLTDVLMPTTNGLELARLLRAARPELPVVFMTGYAGLDESALVELRATGPVLAKPFTQEALLRTVASALEGATARPDIRARPA
jgi:signal transduction histidine kinase/ligand-binding sensor domain-containing protein/ActR/RegA family two-component response regulator